MRGFESHRMQSKCKHLCYVLCAYVIKTWKIRSYVLKTHKNATYLTHSRTHTHASMNYKYAPTRARTGDLSVNSRPLFRLSYTPFLIDFHLCVCAWVSEWVSVWVCMQNNRKNIFGVQWESNPRLLASWARCIPLDHRLSYVRHLRDLNPRVQSTLTKQMQ